MEEGEKYKYIVNEKNPRVAYIVLGPHVLGGNDALDFAAKLDEVAVISDISCVALDLRLVEAMNSSGLGMLVSGLNSLKKHGRNLALAGVPEKVMKLLKMTHLDKVFDIYGALDDVFTNCN